MDDFSDQHTAHTSHGCSGAVPETINRQISYVKFECCGKNVSIRCNINIVVIKYIIDY